MILEYTLSAAAVARGFRAYGATLLGLPPDAGLVHAGPLQLDFFALALVLALSALLCASTADSAAFNAGSGLHKAMSWSWIGHRICFIMRLPHDAGLLHDGKWTGS